MLGFPARKHALPSYMPGDLLVQGFGLPLRVFEYLAGKPSQDSDSQPPHYFAEERGEHEPKQERI